MAAHTKGSHVATKPRLKPPATLSKSAGAIFLATVESVDPSHFSPVDLPLLAQYAGAADLARQAQQHLDAEGAVTPEGKASPWLVVLEKASRSCVALSARLRVCPQSRFDRLVAGANSRQQFGVGKPRPWERDGGPSLLAGEDDGDNLYLD